MEYCIGHNYAGVENLSFIPGSVGAAPIQNIGAYGVEMKNIFHELEAFHLSDKTTLTFNAGDCQFGYRDSIFKHRYKNNLAILNVTFRLDKFPRYQITYADVLKKMNAKDLSIQAISQNIINIRKYKLPDPAKMGNADSWLKNSIVSLEFFNQLKASYPDIKAFDEPGDRKKIAAAWLIESCGWKGIRKGDAGYHANQPLVLVNYGNATGKEVYDLSEEILQSVVEKFGITLEREVNVI